MSRRRRALPGMESSRGWRAKAAELTRPARPTGHPVRPSVLESNCLGEMKGWCPSDNAAAASCCADG